MSAPHQFVIESQHIGYGFLASSVLELLKSRPHELDEHSVELISQAVDFLNDVVRGAEVVSHGECGALTTERSIEALGYAMGPISVLQDVVTTNEDFLRIFNELSAYLVKARQTRSLPSVDPADQVQVIRATLFFDALAQRILSSLSTSRKKDTPNALP